ncbi:MAG: competence/damage-inducible protein A [Desulfohalobiaceae bacterium]|nr:competence/damage-inducible protein A [Desulfohalobiaceae bacterium]
MNTKAEILATGDEIRSGALVDSNSAWIAERLEETGLFVTRHSCVGDDLQELTRVIEEISLRSSLAVVSGGLGPTSDDLTAQAAALAKQTEIVLFPEALAAVESFFQKMNRPMPPSNKKQAMLPRGSSVIDNPVGTAPGFALEINSCLFFFLPGVPREMKEMCRDSVLPRIERIQGPGQQINRIRTITTFGLSESQAAEELKDFDSRFKEIKLGYRTLFPEIQVKLYITGSDQQHLENLEQEAVEWLVHKLGRNIVSAEGKSLPEHTARLLVRRKATLALAESCTGGLLAHCLTSLAGSSEYFLLSAVTYSNQAKQKMLNVSPKTLAAYGAVSEETALEMARGVKEAAGSDYSLSTTGIAGPGGATPGKPVGTVCFGLATPSALTARTLCFNFADRKMNQKIFAFAGLDLLRRQFL